MSNETPKLSPQPKKESTSSNKTTQTDNTSDRKDYTLTIADPKTGTPIGDINIQDTKDIQNYLKANIISYTSNGVTYEIKPIKDEWNWDMVSSLVMIVTAGFMLCANKTAEKSVEITKKNTSMQLIHKLRTEYSSNKKHDIDNYNLLERLAMWVNNGYIDEEIARHSFRQAIENMYNKIKDNNQKYIDVRKLYNDNPAWQEKPTQETNDNSKENNN